MELAASVEIERPIADVWRWYAEDHVRNHPRWDPDLELEQISDGPMGLGTRIRRRNTMGETPVEGEMEMTEWEPMHAVATSIRDGDVRTQDEPRSRSKDPNGPSSRSRPTCRGSTTLSGRGSSRA